MRHLCEVCHHTLSTREQFRGLLRLRRLRAVFTSATGARCTRLARWICAYCEDTWVGSEVPEEPTPAPPQAPSPPETAQPPLRKPVAD